jgi:hypothetical protein
MCGRVAWRGVSVTGGVSFGIARTQVHIKVLTAVPVQPDCNRRRHGISGRWQDRDLRFTHQNRTWVQFSQMVNRPVSIPAARRQTRARAESLREAYRGLRAMGWTEGEAGNLAAHLAGLDVTRKGWRIGEVEALLFIRSLVSTGRLDP